jgi:lysophospholipase L1-like esterase
MARSEHRLRDAALVSLIALMLAGFLEGSLRLGMRLLTGRWPIPAAVSFHDEISRALGLYRRHPFLNTAPREGASAEAFGKEASFNSLGYRSPERPLAKPPSVRRVLCAGGSTTFDILADDDAGTWPRRLEAKLRAIGPDIEVWNAGFPGWTSLENLISLEIRDIDLDPDVVVLFQGINDLQPASHRPFDRQYERGHAEQSVTALGFELDPPRWYERSILVERVRKAIIGLPSPYDKLDTPADRDGLITVIPPVSVTTFERNLRSFVAVARADGAIVVLVTQPLRVRPASRERDLAYLAGWVRGLDPESASGELERLNDVLRDLASEEGVRLADAASDIPWTDGDFVDPMHFSARGSERLAGFLAEIVGGLLSAADHASGERRTEETPQLVAGNAKVLR